MNENLKRISQVQISFPPFQTLIEG